MSVKNTSIKNVNRVFCELAITHLLNFEYQRDFIVKLESVFLSFIKYPGVQINKNAKGNEQMA